MNLAQPAPMTAPALALALLPGDSTDAAMAAGARLADLLDAEFAALKVQDMNAMEQLQADKTAQLQALTAWAAQAAPSQNPADTETDTARLAGWPAFQDLMAQCRQAHWRNETLMSRQLDAIRGTLRALNAGESSGSVELYDRMGQMGRRLGARGYSDA